MRLIIEDTNKNAGQWTARLYIPDGNRTICDYQ